MRDEITETVEIEFVTDNLQYRTHPDFWNEKVRCMKALDFPAGPVNVNVYCGGVIKAVTQIEYYTAVEEIERIFKEVADPIAFACQASKFSSVEKLDNTLTFLLKSKVSAYEFSAFPNEGHHQQANSYLEELPTLLHCAAKFGLTNLANLLLQSPEASQACRITNKHGENPAHIAEKHGHKELQQIIQKLSINSRDNKDDEQEKEEDVEDGVYVTMLGSVSDITSYKPRAGDPYRVRDKAWEESGKKEEDEEEGKEKEAEEDMGMEGKKDEQNNLEKKSCNFDDYSDNVYASIPDNEPEADGRDSFFLDKPPLPPREQLTTIKQDDLPCLSQARKSVEEKKKRDEASDHLEIHGGEDKLGEAEEEDEEDPYTFANEDESLYDMILASDEEKRKEHGSFILNRPPAPAPRPLCSPVKEEHTPYIVQVFKQKATGTHSDNEKMYYAYRKPDKVQTDIAYATLRHRTPCGQEELILLQEQVKKGAITVDEALEKFKQWQNEKSRLEVTQKEKIRQLRSTIIGNRPEEDIFYDNITIEHHPHVSSSNPARRGTDDA
ncbi:B-cell scaffold protein with ankyrin repeats isoform X2 [Carettochelys insculpta]